MFSFSSHYVKMPRHFAARITVVLFCLFLLFTGCSMGGGNGITHTLNEALIGTWDSDGGDSYDITNNHITYRFGEFTTSAGTIEYVTNFSDDSGVLIIKYDDDHKPVYYDSPENYGKPDHILPLKGDYIGIYFKTLKPGVSVEMGGAYIEGGAEKASPEAAITAFTIGNEGMYMSYYGTYTK